MSESEFAVSVCSICRQVLDHPELRGKMFQRKEHPGYAMTFSVTLVQTAGGVDRLLAEWEEVQ